jgi:hypothetical protein
LGAGFETKLESTPVEYFGFALMSMAMAFPLVEMGFVVGALAVGLFAMRVKGRKVSSPPSCLGELTIFGVGKLAATNNQTVERFGAI